MYASKDQQQQQQVIGSLCEKLCADYTHYDDDYELVDCYNPGLLQLDRDTMAHRYSDYKTVLFYELKTQTAAKNSSRKLKKLTLKSRKESYLDFDTTLDFDFADKSLNDQLDVLMNYIGNLLRVKFELKLNETAREWLNLYKSNSRAALDALDNYARLNDLNYYLRLLYPDGYKVYIDALKTQNKPQLAMFVTNLMVLLGQDEYLFYRYFQAKPGVLKVFGSCGNYYMTEYAGDLTHEVRSMNAEERKSLAVKFLQLVHSLDTAYLVHEHASMPMQMCDVKLSNFGLNQQGELKIIDTDTIAIDAQIYREKVCSSHDDCDYFDCKSYCNATSGKCALKRINNNLQTTCEKIFNNSINAEDGILSKPKLFKRNIEHAILSHLNECQNPGYFMNSNVPVASNNSLISVFNIILKNR